MIKRIYVDIETSKMKAWVWRTGKQYIGPENIQEEAKIICICYKWEHEKTVRALDWTDPDMLAKFALLMDEADEIVAHNGKSFDVKWIMWEMLKKRIPAFPVYKVVDTLTMMRSKFKAPSNRLNYLCQILFGKEKIETGGHHLWDEVMDGNKAALRKMVNYCKQDVLLLEELFLTIESYFPGQTNVAVMEGLPRWCCSHCASDNVSLSKTRVTSMGTKRRQMFCHECRHYTTISETVYQKFLEDKRG